jgi:hypothetical protein
MQQYWVSAEYNFATDGGGIGTRTLSKQLGVPAGSIVTECFLDPLTAPASAGAATLSIGVVDAGDILDGVAFDHANLNPANGPSNRSSATEKKTSALKHLVVTIAGAALTAGKFRVLVGYVRSSS